MSDRRTDAQRQRDHELRVKHQLVWTGADLPLTGLEWLIDYGLLAVEHCDDKHALKAAVSEYLWRSFHLKDPTALARLLGLKK